MSPEFDPLSRPQGESKRSKYIRAYLEYERTHDASLDWAVQAMTAMTFLASPVEQWETILEIVREAPDDETVLGAIAAGPVEGLLAQHGAMVIDRFEDEAKQNPKFLRVLTGVWRNRMPEEVWQRVQALQRLCSG
jgi:hypothetical protein